MKVIPILLVFRRNETNESVHLLGAYAYGDGEKLDKDIELYRELHSVSFSEIEIVRTFTGSLYETEGRTL